MAGDATKTAITEIEKLSEKIIFINKYLHKIGGSTNLSKYTEENLQLTGITLEKGHKEINKVDALS